jgi:hypothetical protein
MDEEMARKYTVYHYLPKMASCQDIKITLGYHEFWHFLTMKINVTKHTGQS